MNEHLALLRSVVGPSHSEAHLQAALRHAGGDLAAAINIILDTPHVMPGLLAAKAPVQLQPVATDTICLDDSDDDDKAPPPVNEHNAACLQAVAQRPPPAAWPRSLGDRRILEPEKCVTLTPGSTRAGEQQGATAATEACGNSPTFKKLLMPQKRKPPEASVMETSPKQLMSAQSGNAVHSQVSSFLKRPVGAELEWSFMLGFVQFNAYSTVRVGADERFRSSCDTGTLGPLLCDGARLELRWTLDMKKTKSKAFNAESVGRPGGVIRFCACGLEVGKFPAAIAHMLVPLLARQLVDVDAHVGSCPPCILELGTNVPVVVQVFLRSTALCSSSTPAKVSKGASALLAGQKAVDIDANGSQLKKKAKTMNATELKEEEADREVQKNAIAQLFEHLNLSRRQAAVTRDLGDVSSISSEVGPSISSDVGPGAVAADYSAMESADADADGDEEEAPAQEDMTAEAQAQLGGRQALERADLPAIDLPEDLFGARLHRYQAQAVYWMWQRENPTSELPARWLQGNMETSALTSEIGQEVSKDTEKAHQRPLHPMWDEYELSQPAGPLPGCRGEVRFIYHHRTSGALSLDFPDAALAHCRGGVLADDMGLGKTVMCLALLALDLPTDVPNARDAAPRCCSLEAATPSTTRGVTSFLRTTSDNAVGGTLIVVPVSLMTQWNSEAERHFPPSRRPKVHEWHGGGRHLQPQQLRVMDIVLTTYQTLASEREDGALFQVYWRRIILDEAHTIKNRCSRMAQAAFRLNGFTRWCVTGTPLQNSLDELYALVKFLRLDPWSAWPEWRNAVSLPLDRGRRGDGNAMAQALDAGRRVVQPLLLRRTKATRDPKTQQLLLELPPKHVHVLDLQLSVPERDFYDALFKKAQTQFDTFVSSGEALTKYTHILQLILKLRQALCHPFLVFARDGASDTDFQQMEQRCLSEMSKDSVNTQRFVENLLSELRQGTLPDCPICVDTPEDPAMTPCGHIFCRECAIKAITEWKGECPVCRQPNALSRKSLRILPGASRFPSRLLANASKGGDSSDGGGAGPIQSTKTKALLGFLREDMAAQRRVVVFSQWTSFLDLVGPALDAETIPFRRFDGSLSREERQACVAWFSEGSDADGTAPPNMPQGRVLLISLKAGGVGLNLTVSNRLYLLDLWWNPAVEEQAIQRVHRIGQKSEVHIYKFVVSNSIDTDLLSLQGAKSRLLEDALESGGSRQMGSKLSMDDIKRLFNPCRSLQNLQGSVEAPQVPSDSLADVEQVAGAAAGAG